MKDFMTDRSELIKLLGSNKVTGLSSAQVKANRQKYGANVLERKKNKSLIARIWESATEPMLLMLIGAGIIALGVNIFRGMTGGEADFLECAGIFLAISLSVIISVVMEGRSAKAFEALSKISENTIVKAVRDGKTLMLSQQEIVAGDILVGATFVLQVVFIQFAGAFFGTVPLGIVMWVKLFATAFSVIVLSELVKLAYRTMMKKAKSVRGE